jgi:NAD(P)-dependent dehydrogenase (short-subunit alcohol dehydrogenase family)
MGDTMTRTALITGGGSGIGFAIAEKFTSAGIRTIIVGRNQDRLTAAATRLGPLCVPMVFDLNCLEGIPSFVAGLGSIDILVNNAGVNMKKAFTEVTDADFQSILLTNVTSIFALSREVVGTMLRQGGGSILNISSMASQYGIPKVIAYTASKAAIEGMTRAMAVELSPVGIRVNCIAPGFIATDMSSKAMDDDPERKQKALDRTPMGVFGAPGDVGAAALFLCSDTARYITGVVLPVDGGNSVGF